MNAITLLAAAVCAFQVDFKAEKPMCDVEHYEANSVHTFTEYNGKPAVVIRKAEKGGEDTCWTFRTDSFDVTEGREFAVALRTGGVSSRFIFRLDSNIEWLDKDGKAVMNINAAGKAVPQKTKLRRLKRSDDPKLWSVTITKGIVPTGVSKARLRIQSDYPNLIPSDVMVFSGVKYFEHPLGESWQFDDLDSPKIKLLTTTPNADRKAVIRFTLTDKSEIKWDKVNLNFDGKEIPANEVVWDGREIVIKPNGGEWAAESVHTIKVAAEDIHGNTGIDWAFIAFTTTEIKHPKWTIRDDGMFLKDGEPWFPLGVCNVYPCEVNNNSCREAVKDLMAAGMNMPHTYMVRGRNSTPRYDELVDACSEQDAYLWSEPAIRKGAGRDEMFFKNVLNGRSRKGLCGWGLGDDTSEGQTADELRRSYTISRAIDPDMLTISVDIVRDPSQQLAYIPYADVLAIETYPIREAERQPNEMAEFMRALDWGWQSVNVVGMSGRTILSVPQMFKGWSGWKRYPTHEEVKCFAWMSICGKARGIVYYTYHKPKETNCFGVMCTTEHRDFFFGMMKEIASYRSSLVLRDAKVQPTVEVIKGPTKNGLGGDSMRVLMKADGKLFAVNTSDETVHARIVLPTGEKFEHTFAQFGTLVR